MNQKDRMKSILRVDKRDQFVDHEKGRLTNEKSREKEGGTDVRTQEAGIIDGSEKEQH